MHIDLKMTIWERLHIHKGDEEAILNAIRENNLKTEEQLNKFISEFHSREFLLDTAEFIETKENENCATIEVFDEDDENIYDNTGTKFFKFELTHDNGKTTIIVPSTSIDNARRIIMLSEKCPSNAIEFISV